MTRGLSRRHALATGAGAALLPLVHMRTAHAAGSLSVGFWDHWVPSGNDVMTKQVHAWADKNKVDVQIDFITGNGNKLLMTKAAESQARTGHDFITFQTWEVNQYADQLENVDDLMKGLTDKFGPTNEVCEYLGRVKGHWHAVPTSSGTQFKGPCGRISLLKQMAGLDVVGMYPARPEHTAAADGWTYDAMLKVMAACKKGGKPFGIGLGLTTDWSIPPARSSRRSAPSWSMARATSRSAPTRCVRCLNTRSSTRRTCPTTRSAMTTRATTGR